MTFSGNKDMHSMLHVSLSEFARNKSQTFRFIRVSNQNNGKLKNNMLPASLSPLLLSRLVSYLSVWLCDHRYTDKCEGKNRSCHRKSLICVFEYILCLSRYNSIRCYLLTACIFFTLSLTCNNNGSGRFASEQHTNELINILCWWVFRRVRSSSTVMHF